MPSTQTHLLSFLLAILLIACDQNNSSNKITLNGQTMGTHYSIILKTQATSINQQTLQAQIDHLLMTINASMSTYDPNSELSKLNQTNSTACLPLSKPLFSVVQTAQSLSQLSNGAFDITIGPLVNLWGFGPDRDITRPPSNEAIKKIQASIGFQNIKLNSQEQCLQKLNPTIYIDLSAIAKGYAIDQIALLLESYNIYDYLVEIGGDMRANTTQEKWRIAIEEPNKNLSQAPHKILTINNHAIATSGDYRNYFTQGNIHYSHIIDPSTGKPVRHNLVSVTVIEKSATLADGLATLLLVLGPDKGFELAEEKNISAYFISVKENRFHSRATSHFLKGKFEPH